MSSNWLSWFQASPKEREESETRDLLVAAKAAQRTARLGDDAAIQSLASDIIAEVCERHDVTPSVPLSEALFEVIRDLLYFDSLAFDLPTEGDLDTLTIDEGVSLRARLRTHLRFMQARSRLLPLWSDKLTWIFAGMLGYLPPSAFTDLDEDGVASDDSVVFPKARILDLCDNVPEVIERLLCTLYDQDIVEAQLFERVRERIEENLYTASGVPPHRRHDAAGKLVVPTQSKLSDPEALVAAYC